MPVYTINGQRIRTDKDLSDAEIDEIAAELNVSTKPETGAPIGSQLAAQIPTGGTQAPAVRPAAPSGFVQGLLDPIRGGAELISRGLGSLGSQYFQKEAERMTESMKAEEQAYQAQRKAAGVEGFDTARLAGNILNPVSLLSAGGATIPAQAIRTGVLQGVLQPALDEEAGYAEQKAKQAAGGAIGGLAGAGATKLIGKALNPLTSQAEQTMKELGVQLTPGQLMGGQAKDIESFAANLPLVGSYISDAKEKALFSFNKGVINKTLGRIQEKLPEEVIGRDAVAYTQTKVDEAYDDVLSRITYKLDFPSYSGMLKAIKSPSSVLDRTRVKDELEARVFSRLPKGEAVDGNTYKTIESDLRARIAQLNRGSVSDQDVAEALREASSALKEGMKKQNPKEVSTLRRIDSAYRDLTIMENAASKTGAQNGVFTPKQYQAAVREGDVTKRKRQFAAGKARGQDVSEAAVDIMEGTPSYNLEGRLAYNLLGGAGLLSNLAVAPALAIAAPVMYSDSGMKAMQTIMRSRPEVARKVGDILTKRASKEGSITGANVLEEYNKAVRAEE
jgi:hypothetical protein